MGARAGGVSCSDRTTPTVVRFPPQRPIWNSFTTDAVRDFWENGCSVGHPDKQSLVTSARLCARVSSGAHLPRLNPTRIHPVTLTCGLCTGVLEGETRRLTRFYNVPLPDRASVTRKSPASARPLPGTPQPATPLPPATGLRHAGTAPATSLPRPWPAASKRPKCRVWSTPPLARGQIQSARRSCQWWR